MTKAEWDAHCAARTLHYHGTMLRWAVRRLIVLTGVTRWARETLNKLERALK